MRSKQGASCRQAACSKRTADASRRSSMLRSRALDRLQHACLPRVLAGVLAGAAVFWQRVRRATCDPGSGLPCRACQRCASQPLYVRPFADARDASAPARLQGSPVPPPDLPLGLRLKSTAASSSAGTRSPPLRVPCASRTPSKRDSTLERMNDEKHGHGRAHASVRQEAEGAALRQTQAPRQ